MTASHRIVAAPCWAPLLAALHEESFVHPGDEAWSAKAFAGLLEAPACFAVVAETVDGPAGLALFRVAAGEAEVLTIGVRPADRSAGIGAGLLGAGLAECARRGALKVLLEVAAGNAAAQSLYRRRGFVEVGRRRRYYRDGSDALVLSLGLTGGVSTPA